MAVHGADIAQLRTTAAKLNAGADTLTSSVQTLSSLIGHGTQWRGPDADRFRSEWTGLSTRVLAAAAESLRSAAEQLRRNADEQEQASTAPWGSTPGQTAAPTNTAQLLNHIKNDVDDGDGLRIERVVGPDEETRLVVYFKGQDSTGVRNLDRSADLAAGRIGVDEKLARLIDEALKDCPDGKATEVMLVGLSQGGMDAQNFAASGRYNVTTLVTYGSPVVQSDVPNINTVHMHADGDPVPAASELQAERSFNEALRNMGEGKYVPGIGLGSFLVDAAARPNSDQVFSSDPGLGWGMQVHERGYPDVAADFDRSSDPRFAAVKDDMKKFQGTIVSVQE